LKVLAGNDLTAVASKLKAADEAYLYAGNQLSLLAAQNSDYSLYDKQKKGGWGSKETQRDEVTTIRNIGTSITTGGDLTLVSEGDQLYQRARLESGNDLTLDSGGSITFEAVKDLDQESHEKEDSSFVWTSTKGKGNTDETLRQSVLLAKGEVVIKAVDGLHIDIKQINQKSVSQTIDAMVKAEPELAWLKEAEARGDVDWRRVKEIHESFKYQNSSLGGGAAIIIAIVLSVITAGAGAAIAAGVGGAVGGGTMGTVVGAMAQGAFHASVTQTAISTINNKGNPLAVIKDTHSAESIKGYAVAGISAGITAGVVNKAWGADANVANKGFDLGTVKGAAQYVGYSASNAVVQAGVGTAVYGGSFSESLKGSLNSQLQGALQAIAFNAVGDYSKEQNWGTGSPQKIALHAMVGGLLSEAAGGDFATGALAAGANEALVKQLDALVKYDDRFLNAASQLVGVAAAAASDDDLQLGADIAGNATSFNYLSHDQLVRAASKLRSCSDQACVDKTQREFLALSFEQDVEAVQACLLDVSLCKPASLAVANTVADLNAAYEALGDGPTGAFEALRASNLEFQETLAMATAGHSADAVVDALGVKWNLTPAQVSELRDGLVVGAALAGGSVAALRAKAAIADAKKTIANREVQVGPKATDSASNVALFERQRAGYAAQEIRNAQPVGSALKDDPLHRAPSYVIDQIPEKGRLFTIRGGDGKSYNLTQMEGAVDGKSGIFEWLVNSTGELTHQRFIPAGKITGMPNQVPSRLPR
jgi:hypothetical protein